MIQNLNRLGLVSVLAIIAFGCGPHATYPDRDSGTSTIPPIQTLPLKLSNCHSVNGSSAYTLTSKSGDFPWTFLGGNFATACTSSGIERYSEEYQCDVSVDTTNPENPKKLMDILNSANLYVRVNEKFWFPTVISSGSVFIDPNSYLYSIAISTQGQLELIGLVNSQKKTYSIGGPRTSLLQTNTARPIRTYIDEEQDYILRFINASDRINSITKLNFKIPSLCELTGMAGTPLMNAEPEWTINSISVFSSKDFP